MGSGAADAIDDLAEALAGTAPLDVTHCRQLALTITGRIADAKMGGELNEALCSIVEEHALDPVGALWRFEFYEPMLRAATR